MSRFIDNDGDEVPKCDGGRVPIVPGAVAFGKRTQSLERDVSFIKTRLELLAAEINLYSVGKGDLAEMVGDERLSLLIGASLGLSLSVEIDSWNGLYVFRDGGKEADCIIVTAREDRLIDCVLSAVARGRSGSRATDGVVDELVGHSLDDVERRLVLRTLIRFGGNRRQTANMLGIDERDLRARLRRYFLTSQTRTRDNFTVGPR